MTPKHQNESGDEGGKKQSAATKASGVLGEKTHQNHQGAENGKASLDKGKTSKSVGYNKELPLKKALFDYTNKLYRKKYALPKVLKYDLGMALCESAIRAMRLVVFANSAVDKEKPLLELKAELDLQWIYLALLREQRGMKDGEYATFAVLLGNICTQVVAWRKWSRDRLVQTKINGLGKSEILKTET